MSSTWQYIFSCFWAPGFRFCTCPYLHCFLGYLPSLWISKVVAVFNIRLLASSTSSSTFWIRSSAEWGLTEVLQHSLFRNVWVMVHKTTSVVFHSLQEKWNESLMSHITPSFTFSPTLTKKPLHNSKAFATHLSHRQDLMCAFWKEKGELVRVLSVQTSAHGNCINFHTHTLLFSTHGALKLSRYSARQEDICTFPMVLFHVLVCVYVCVTPGDTCAWHSSHKPLPYFPPCRQHQATSWHHGAIQCFYTLLLIASDIHIKSVSILI